MYYLVVLNGNYRGKTYKIDSGSASIGRSPDNDICLDLNGVSSLHCRIKITGTKVFVEDLGSSNGTFINNKVIKKETVKLGDRIAIPGCIFTITHAKKGEIQDYDAELDNQESSNQSSEIIFNDLVPDLNPKANTLEKINYLVSKRVVAKLLELSRHYEFQNIFIILFIIYVAIGVHLSVSPVLDLTDSVVKTELLKRAQVYAQQIIDINKVSLGRLEIDRIDTRILSDDSEVLEYELTDMRMRILHPVARQNIASNNPFSIELRETITKSGGTVTELVKFLSDGSLKYGKLITAHKVSSNNEEPIGFVSIHLKSKEGTLFSGSKRNAFVIGFVKVSMLSILFLFLSYKILALIIVYLLKSIEFIQFQTKSKFSSDYQIEILNPIFKSLQNLHFYINDLKGSGLEDGDSMEESNEIYLENIRRIVSTVEAPVLGLSDDMRLVSLNGQGEDLLGIREDSSVDSDLIDIIRNQGLSATIVDLCEQCRGDDTVVEDNFEINGRDYSIKACSVIGKDGYSKGFIVSFNGVES